MCGDILLRHVCHPTPWAQSRKDRVGGERKRLHAPTISLRCLDNAKCGSILHAPTRVLEFRFAINFRARLLRKAFQVDLRPQGSDTMLPTEGDRKEHCLTRGVLPTAPVKPFTECDVKLLKGTDFNTVALDGIMVVGERSETDKIP